MQDPRYLPNRITSSLVFLLGCVLLFSAPFGHALEIHHVFAEVDHDGHEHSEHDLCTWVQHHAGGSLVDNLCSPVIFIGIESISPALNQSWISTRLLHVDGSRAPPAR